MKEKLKITLPQKYTCSMLPSEAAARTVASTIVNGVKFHTIQAEASLPGHVVGQTTVKNLADLDTFNNILEDTFKP